MSPAQAIASHGQGYVFLVNVTGTSCGRGVTHISMMLMGPNQAIRNPGFLCLQEDGDDS